MTFARINRESEMRMRSTTGAHLLILSMLWRPPCTCCDTSAQRKNSSRMSNTVSGNAQVPTVLLLVCKAIPVCTCEPSVVWVYGIQ
jgi:hypothetical protein